MKPADFDSLVALIRRYDRPGPRYTSYPTAVEFIELSTSRPIARSWLVARRPTSRCRSICTCRSARSAARSAAARSSSPGSARSRRNTRLPASRDRDAGRGARGRRQVVQYHWGGGTPTYSRSRRSRRCRPRSNATSTSSLARKSRSRWTRASPPSSSSRCSHASGSTGCPSASRTSRPKCRKPSTASSRSRSRGRCSRQAARLGFESINVDLIYGLPLQTRASFASTRRRRRRDAARPGRRLLLRARAVDSAGTRRASNPEDLPPPSARSSCSSRRWSDSGRRLRADRHGPLRAAGRRAGAGLAAGRLHRNFMGYTTRPAPDMVAAGVSASATWAARSRRTRRSCPTYYAAIDAGRFPIERGYRLDADDHVRRHVITSLMCNFHVDVAADRSADGIRVRRLLRRELSSSAEGAAGRLRSPGRGLRRGHAHRPDVRAKRRDGFDRHLREKANDTRPVFSRTV